MLLGKEESILGPLFSFNLGLELGQLLIVGLLLIISFIFVGLFKVDRKRYVQAGSVIAIILALNMVVERIATFLMIIFNYEKFIYIGLFLLSTCSVLAQDIRNNPSSNHGNKFEQLGTILATPNEYRTASGAPRSKVLATTSRL